MIAINVKARQYTLEELRELFSRFSDIDEDFEDFISAMQLTNQLVETRDGVFAPTKISSRKLETVRYESFPTVLAGGSSKIETPRTGIHALKREARLIPTEMRLIKYMDAKGNWIEVLERPSLRPQRPREHELWRAEIPASIRKKYGIKPGQNIRVAIGRVSKRYFSRLRLWGYNIQGMISFGETGKHQSDRDLEIHGFNFSYEAKPNLRGQMDLMGTKLLNVTMAWLESYDTIYHDIFLMGGVNQTETKSPTPIEGIGPEPILSKPKTPSKLQFRDLQKGINIASASGKLPLDWHEMLPENVSSLFGFEEDNIGHAHGYKGRKEGYLKLKTMQTTLTELKQKEGFKKGKKK